VSFIDLFWAADWDGLYRTLAKGNPPLALQLLTLNTIFFIIYVMRKITSKHKLRSTTREVVQLILVLFNLAIVFQEDVLSIAAPYISKISGLI
jgi:hypothetical protein